MMRLIQLDLLYGFAIILFFSIIVLSFTSMVIGQEQPPAIDVGEDGVLFATLLHTSQFVSIVVFGGISFIISLFLHKNPNGNEPENITS